MAMAIIVIVSLFFVSFLIVCLLMAFSSEEEPEWNREEILITPIQKESLIPIPEDVTEAVEINDAVAQYQSSTVYQPEVVQTDMKAVGS